MSEIKTEIKQNDDGSYTITDAHSTSDIVRWLLTQDDKETILYLLEPPQQRPSRSDMTWVDATTWVGLTDEERNLISRSHAYVDMIIIAAEAKLKEKNT